MLLSSKEKRAVSSFADYSRIPVWYRDKGLCCLSSLPVLPDRMSGFIEKKMDACRHADFMLYPSAGEFYAYFACGAGEFLCGPVLTTHC